MSGKKLKFGCGKAKLDFSNVAFPINGFSGIDDPLYARSFVFDSNQKILIISIELPSLTNELVGELKKQICTTYNFIDTNIWISVTHTFCAPHATPKYDPMIEIVTKAVMESVHKATQKYQEVNIGYGKCKSNINVNRNVETSLGWWIGHNIEEYSNHDVRIIKIIAVKTHQVLGIIINYDIQSAVMAQVEDNQGKLQITSDVMGCICKNIEEYYHGETIALFLLGAAGDQAPVYQGRYAFVSNGKIQYKQEYLLGRKNLSIISDAFVNSFLQKIETIKSSKKGEIQHFYKKIHVNEKIMPIPTKELLPTSSFDFRLTGKKIEIKIEAFLIGNILLLGTKPEINSKLGKCILDHSPMEHTILCTMINGGMKYLPEPIDFKRRTYTAMNSIFGEGSSEIFYQAVLDLFKEIKVYK